MSAHANSGISVGGLARELSYGGAIAHRSGDARVSVIGELLGRWIDSPGHRSRVIAPHPTLTASRRSA